MDVPAAPADRGRSLSDAGAVVLAVAVVAGAWLHLGVPLFVSLTVVFVAFLLRRPSLLVVGGFVLAGTLGARAMAGLGPVAPGPYQGPVTLLSDPEPTPFGSRVDVRVGTQRVELQASGSAAGTVDTSLAGERLSVAGRLRPPPPDAPWLVPRHVVGRLVVDRAERLDAGALPWRAANRFRRMLDRGSEALPQPTRSLYGGFVLGDGRGQPPELVDDFRGSGLAHLLVVSGSNVAFVLVLASPISGRFGLISRWLVTVSVIGAFGVLTRFEPSVLRASAMAAIAVTAASTGRSIASVRILALAVSSLVLVDPLLVRSVGFQLSVAASGGIALLAAPIADRLSGPRWWVDPLAVTLAAQAGVAPVLLPAFGGMPVVSIVANVLAVPVAGLVTTWGLPAGVLAGVAGPGVARVVHAPTGWMIDWVAAVARVGASLPLGEIQVRGFVILVVAATVLVTGWPRGPAVKTAAAMVAVAALVAPAVALRFPPGRVAVATGTNLHRAGGATVLVLDDDVGVSRLMEGLRRAGVRRLDAVAAREQPPPEVMDALRHRWPIGQVVTTESGGGPEVVEIGPLLIDLTGDQPVVSARGGAPRGTG